VIKEVDVSRSPGRLVALCGIDASGKTTQTELLSRHAEAAGLSVRQVSFPRYGESFFADLIQRYLRGEFAQQAGDVSPYLAALPYACDRQQAAPQLRAWLEEGCLVICNRYVPANLAHQGSKIGDPAARRAFFNWDTQLEYDVFGLPRPDLQVLLDVPVDLALALLRGRNARNERGNDHDIHEADAAYLRTTAETYRQVAAETPGPWAVVDCAEGDRLLSAERIAEKVWANVQQVLYNKS
jgi:dTMP kinase